MSITHTSHSAKWLDRCFLGESQRESLGKKSKQWDYCCVKCDDFRVHTFCATNEVKPGLYLDDDDDDRLDSGAIEAAQLGHFQSGCEDQLEVQLSEEAIVELFKIQLQMQMAEQLAEIQFIGNMQRFHGESFLTPPGEVAMFCR
ncbi:hypothetical protein HYC85_022396 [Camellia sinensis]|uniref:DC1 domain-containing protein n=1 Tax=Camellia sinensis TaxID=4442 RepID=A0A7J7GKA6_CAMSI|nr:hypothetical protein HYC85_022396 [Camellia sinensis]